MKRIFSFTSHYSIRTFSYNQIIFSSHCTRIQSNLKFELYHRHLQLRDMSQKSITSFFSKTPKKVDKSTEANKVSKIKRERSESDEGTLNDQQVNVKINKKIKIENDISQVSPSKSRSSSPEITPNVKKNVKKRQVVESSDSDVSPAKKSPVLSEKVADKKSKDQKKSPKRGKKSPDPSEKVDDSKSKSQKKSPKRESQSPESEVKKEKEDIKSPLSEKDSNVSGSETKKKDGGLGGFFIKRDGGKETKVDPNLVSDIEYTPLKSNYHPINDACWSKDAKVPYIALTNTLQAIEDTSARLKMVELLSNFLRSVIVLSPDDLLPCVYLCLNKLAPAYEGIELGVAETYLMKAISQSTGRTLAQIKSDASKCGDLGIVAEQSKSNQRMMFKPASLTVAGVFKALKEVASMSGNTAMNKKVSKIQSVFVACRHSEAKYFIRSLAGKLRIGLAEQSVLQALAQATVTTPPRGDTWPPQVLNAAKGVSAEEFKSRIDEQALIIKTTYCQCPNYDMIIPVIITKGVSDLPSECKLTPGIPLKPMLAHPTKGIHEVFERFENLRFTCEWKYDGERAQIHIPSDGNGTIDLKRASIFSRNQENNTSKYPDVMTRLDKLCKEGVNSCVLDCEAVGWDIENKKILPFQILSTRKRKDANISDIKVQVCLFIFDLLYLNGEALVTKSLEHRRQLLKGHFNEVPGEWLFATSRDCSTMEEVQEFLEESIKGSCEGLMVKTLEGKDATYEIAKRSRNWLKLKKDYLDGVGDTLDVVVIGGYHGRGKRTGVYGGFLLACYDNESEEYQSICKIGTGFTEDDLMNHSNTLNQFVIDRPRSYYRYDSSHEPDVWFSAHEVWEVKCADLSLSPVHRAAMGLVNPDKGISLRFPRFVRIRDDKKAEEATSSRQVADIYLNQDQVKNQTSTSNSKNNMDDDFY